MHLPWDRGEPPPSGGSGAQPQGSAECNDCMQTPGGHLLVTHCLWLSNSFETQEWLTMLAERRSSKMPYSGPLSSPLTQCPKYLSVIAMFTYWYLLWEVKNKKRRCNFCSWPSSVVIYSCDNTAVPSQSLQTEVVLPLASWRLATGRLKRETKKLQESSP